MIASTVVVARARCLVEQIGVVAWMCLDPASYRRLEVGDRAFRGVGDLDELCGILGFGSTVGYHHHDRLSGVGGVGVGEERASPWRRQLEALL